MSAVCHLVHPSAAPTLIWHCPGCNGSHAVPLNRWTWNWSTEAPTLSPSVLVTVPGTPERCHCFVENGRIRFLEDCSHALAGQTVAMEAES